MGVCDLKDLFPTRISAVVFVSYMALFINQGLLVTSTKNEQNKYNYNIISCVLMTEIFKLIMSSLIYLKEFVSLPNFSLSLNTHAVFYSSHSFYKMIEEIKLNKIVFLRYFIPSFLYCLYNNLTFVNLTSYDPTTYFLLLQLRVVVTGIVFQILFSKRLTNIQWLSLILLTFGCVIKQIGHVKTQSIESNTSSTSFATSPFDYFNLSLILILVQVFCSCFAGVYNEYLLKDSTNSAHIMIQNVFMYIDSIICNLLILSLSGLFGLSSTTNLSNIFSSESLAQLFQFKVFLIMLNNALIGIVTSLFLKSLNSILKAFASALELMFTGVLSWLIFGIPLDANTITAILIVSFSTWLYSKNPVQNPAPVATNETRQNV